MSPAQKKHLPADVPAAAVVLVVEDEVLVRMAIADYLRDCGYGVIEAGNAREALTLFENGTKIDVVFTDVRMPGEMDGFGLAQWVRANRPGVEVIITSGGEKKAEAAGELCEEGPSLAKPYEPVEVHRRIQSLLAARERAQKDRTD